MATLKIARRDAMLADVRVWNIVESGDVDSFIYLGKHVRLTAACKAHVCSTQPPGEHEILCRCATVSELISGCFP